MNPFAVGALLDQSCGQALFSWFKDRPCAHDKAHRTMELLPRKLGGNEEPDYDDHYTPPAYVIRYQLGHSLMAWRSLTVLSQRLSDWYEQPLRIVDFGAGTSACRIGAALMAAEAIEKGHDVQGIQVDEIDVSASMQKMGELIWREFEARVQLGFANTPLAHAVAIVEGTQHKNWRVLERQPKPTWLTAFHSIYPKSYDMEVEIGNLIREVSPHAGAFSCHKFKLGKLREAFPFDTLGKLERDFFPKFRGATDGKVHCPDTHLGYRGASTYLGELAVVYGFRKRNLPPFLQVKDCAILFGVRVPL